MYKPWIGAVAFVLLGAGVADAQHAIDNGPWQQQNIGNVGIAGSATEGPDGDLFVNGAGSDIWGASDSFFFLYQQIWDGTIQSNPPAQDATNPHAKVGLMYRATLDADSPDVILDVQPDGSVEFMERATRGGPTTFINGLAPAGHPWELTLERVNSAVRATICWNSTCLYLGQAHLDGDVVYVGAAVTSHDPSTLNHGTFPASPPRVSTVPGTWYSSDVGNVGLAGSAFYANGTSTFTVKGAGSDIWGTADSYHFVRDLMTGDGTISARVTAEDAANTFAKAGLLVVDPSGTQTVVYDMRPNGFAEFMARTANGGQMQFIASSYTPFPSFLKLERVGNVFTAFWSQDDGATWNQTGQVTVPMQRQVYAGLAVTSHDTTALNTATFDHVQIASTVAGDIDIGDVGAAGSWTESASAGRYFQNGSGADIWGSRDAFNFHLASMFGDATVQTLLLGMGSDSSSDPADPFAKAGVMIRETVDPSSAHVILDVRPGGEIEFMVRPSTGAPTQFIAGGTTTFPVNLRLVRTGSTITAQTSPDATNNASWTTIGSVNVNFRTDTLAGTAVTSHQRGKIAFGYFQ